MTEMKESFLEPTWMLVQGRVSDPEGPCTRPPDANENRSIRTTLRVVSMKEFINTTMKVVNVFTSFTFRSPLNGGKFVRTFLRFCNNVRTILHTFWGCLPWNRRNVPGIERTGSFL